MKFVKIGVQLRQMDQYQFINSKRKEDAVKKLYQLFKSVYQENGEATFQMNGETVSLSQKAAHLGIMLLNGFKVYRDDEEHWYFNDSVVFNSKRHQAFIDKFGTEIWDESTKPLLWLALGEEIAPLVLKAWNELPKYMYQSGLSRRSFRIPKNKSINYLRQLNF